MDFESIKSAIRFAHDSHLVSRLVRRDSRMEAEAQADSYALGMATAFELAGLLTAEEAENILLGMND